MQDRLRTLLLPRRGRGGAAALLCAASPLLLLPGALVLSSGTAAEAAPPRRGPQEGDVLKVFDGGRVYVVTNDDPALADVFLQGAAPKERRVLSIEEWEALPEGTRFYLSAVFLINRQKLPAGAAFPAGCAPADDELWTQSVRRGRDWGVAYDVTLSAPDGVWLRRAIDEFRRLKAPPRGFEPRKLAVASLAVVPVGSGAEQAARKLLSTARTQGGLERPPHVVPPDDLAARAARLERVDEVVLIDRGGVASPDALPDPVVKAVAGRMVGANDTVAWRERKPSGRSRVVITAPTPGMLAEALRRYPDPLLVPEEPVTVATARDLRGVRRVAVAAVKGHGTPEAVARQVASRAATEVRSLDAFEVLDRAGLDEILSEIALDQAGITQAKDRARVRQIAAADALLIVEVTEVTARTEYNARHERMTPKMGPAPQPPAQPSRLRYGISLPGKEHDPIARALTDALLGKVVGRRSSRDYRDSVRAYEDDALPAYLRQREAYYEERRTRPINWKQSLLSRSSVTVSGSLRLVDLTDGLVLWEQPFATTCRDEAPAGTRTVTTRGEDSHPGAAECPPASEEAPEVLLARAAEQGVCEALGAMKTTALLPPPTASAAVVAADGSSDDPVLVTASESAAGRILDIDGPSLLVGLGATDGVAVGDVLTVEVPGGKPGASPVVARLKVTRVRPRTCDTLFLAATPAALRARVAVGMDARRQAGSAPAPVATSGAGKQGG